MSHPEPSNESIAVVGLAGRFPGARDLAEFWSNLAGGIESISRFAAEELAAEGVDPAALSSARYVRARGVLEEAEWFDAAFFGYTPREAEAMDPQQRMFLECAHEAMEAAGYGDERGCGVVGVFAGVGPSAYLFNALSNRAWAAALGEYQSLLLHGNDKDHVATRVSYKLNLKGPSLNVQTACSTSLVAVHLACHQLATFQCDLALAGAASIAFPQRAGYWYQEGGIVSPDGHCRAFDAAAAGTVFGGGAGVVVLKRLADALADGDPVRAVILGSAVNNDGALRAGYTAPSLEGQAQVVAMAHAVAGVEPRSIQFIEAHGTGTALGDPIEVGALREVFGGRAGARATCALGSVKSNVGHLNAAAGVAGLIKVVLALEHRQMPPSLHFRAPNPKLGLEESPFYINAGLRAWETSGGPRRAGVSSFGIGGTNAHVVVEEAPPAPPSGPSRPRQLLVWSARSASALRAAGSNLGGYLAAAPEAELADVAWTLQAGRKALEQRAFLVCAGAGEAAARIQAGKASSGVAKTAPKLVMMFSGQGAQYPGMTRALYEGEATYREELERCGRALRAGAGVDLEELLFAAEDTEAARRRLARTEHAQPALFAVEYALARLWESWGVKADALIGHSVGEYVAAVLAGVFSLEDALRLVAERGKLMSRMPAGAMTAAPLSRDEAKQVLEGESELWLASVNGPRLCVFSGTVARIEALEGRMDAAGKPCRRLATSHAFHSGLMDPVMEPFRALVQATPVAPPRRRFISNLTGNWAEASVVADSEYWVKHLRECVEFGAGLETLAALEPVVFLEVGPGRSLAQMALSQFKGRAGVAVVATSKAAEAGGEELARILHAAGRLWQEGIEMDWRGFRGAEKRRRICLPTYPFERRRYWVEPERGRGGAARSSVIEKARELADWFYVPSWVRSPLPAPPPPERRPCVVFADAQGVGEALAGEWRREGHPVLMVKPGRGFASCGEDIVEIDPGTRGDYLQLARVLAQRGWKSALLAHLWALNGDGRGSDPHGAFEDAQRWGFGSGLMLAQALIEDCWAGPIDLCFVTEGAVEVSGEEPLVPARATLLGLAKVIGQEYPDIRSRIVDAELRAAPARAGARLAAELLADEFEPVVAHRGSYRWVQRPRRWAPPAGGRTLVRRGGVYWLTGGLGEMGLSLAEWLFETCDARLVLTSRAELPPPQQWEAHLSGGAGEPQSETIQRLARLKARGAEILVARADVACAREMRVALAAAEARFGTVQGVVHAAGIMKSRLLPALDGAACGEYFRAKAHGLMVLDQVLGDRAVDFVLAASSLAAVLGGLGYAGYAAANAFMDVYAQLKNRSSQGGRSSAWVSVNWDAWNFAGRRSRASSGGESAELRMSAQEGAEIFRRILDGGTSGSVIVSTGDLDARLDKWVRRVSPRETQAPAVAPAQHPRPELTQAFEAPRNAIEQAIAKEWQELLGLERVGVHDDFFELGGHSLLATQVLSRLRTVFRLDLPVNVLFEAPTVALLGDVILSRQAEAVDAETLERMVEEIRGMPMEEIQARLKAAQEGAG